MRMIVLVLGCAGLASIASAQSSLFFVYMDGAQVPTASTFTGSGTITLNAAETQITLDLTHNIPSAQVTNGHIHIGDVGVNGGIVFPLSGLGQSPITDTFAVTSGQVTTLKANGYYVNIHTNAFPNGEIRGQIVFAGTGLPTSTWVGVGAAGLTVVLAGSAYAYRRRQRSAAAA